MQRSILFQPIRIGTMQVKNRIVMAPMDSKLADVNGAVTDRMIAYLAARARGGVGLIVVEHAVVEWPRGRNSAINLNISHDRFVPGLGALVDALHLDGAKVALQIDHAGRQSSLAATDGTPLISASDVGFPPSGTVPRPMTREEITEMVQKFGQAARRARVAGFDAVMLHGANGYLLASFLSRYTNRRTDEYGGSLENRVRFLVEIVDEVRRQTAPDYPILCRLNGTDNVEGGLDAAESAEIAKRLEAAGVNGIDVSAGFYESREWTFPPMEAEPGCQLPATATIKRTVTIPVIAIGKINTPELAERVVRDGLADMVSFGRELLAEPELALKIAEGHEEDIRPCIYCNGCILRIRGPLHVSCTVNPTTSRERELTITQAPVSKRVAVVGGGPAGLEAARVAAQRGHRVTLFERSDELGGKVRLSAEIPWRRDLLPWLRHASRQLAQNGVEIRRGTEFTAELAVDFRPDVVLLAAGADSSVPARSADGHVPVVTPDQILTGDATVGDDVVVLGGGHLLCEIATLLADKGRRVTIVEPGPDLSLDFELGNRAMLLQHLQRSGVTALTGSQVTRFKPGAVVVSRPSEERTIPAETVVVPAARSPRRELAAQLAGRVADVRAIGDCTGAGGLMNAILDANLVARQI